MEGKEGPSEEEINAQLLQQALDLVGEAHDSDPDAGSDADSDSDPDSDDSPVSSDLAPEEEAMVQQLAGQINELMAGEGEEGEEGGMNPELEESIQKLLAELQDSPEPPPLTPEEVRIKNLNQKIKHDSPAPAYGCPHYLRRCRLKAPCCDAYFDCRLCHDQEKDQLEPDYDLKHTLDRYAVTQIQCMVCEEEQPVSNECLKCRTVFGQYYCETCRLYDDVDKDQYHCEKCGLCRINKKSMEHCETCNICYGKGEHQCLPESHLIECPICAQLITSSTKTYLKLKCGHLCHQSCLQMYLKKDYRCPLCQKAVMDLTMLNSSIEASIQAQPMPEKYQRRAQVYCIECEQIGETDFHFLAMKCPHCGAYNTREQS